MSYNGSMKKRVYDCIVIGGGVIGCSVARFLTRYGGDFLLIEKSNDVATGTSKANSGIVHAGYDALPQTNKARFNVRGSAMMPKLCEQLQVPYVNNGAYVLSFGDDSAIKTLKERGDKNGVKTEIVTGDFVRKTQPVRDTVTVALYAPQSAIVGPYELTTALYENYLANGGNVLLNAAVDDVSVSGGNYTVTVGKKKYEARAVVNCAGLYSDVINNAACDKKYTVVARRGEYCLLDKAAYSVSATLFQTPTKMGKGVLITPTCHKNTIIGPTADDIDDKTDVATTYDGLKHAWDCAAQSAELSKRDIITQFAGLRARLKETDDFVIGECREGFFNALGVDSPGLASSPAIGEKLADDVAQYLRLDENKKFDPSRAAIVSFASATDDEREKLIAENPQYGNVICRCETVTEAEIVESIKRGAVDLDGIKRRTRAGMGRCQAGFCMPKLMKILERELGIDAYEVTKSGGESYILKGGAHDGR